MRPHREPTHAEIVAAELIGGTRSSTRKMPWLQWFLVCDRVEQHANGGVTLHQTKSAILVPAFPAHVRFVATASFHDGDGEPYRYEVVFVPTAGPPAVKRDTFPIAPNRSQESEVSVVLKLAGPVTYFLVAFLESQIVSAARIDFEQLTEAVAHEVTH